MRKTMIVGTIVLLFICANVTNAIGFENKIVVSNTDFFPIEKTEIIVDDEGDGDFTSIQEAIYNSTSGDIIKVYSGTYNESINVYVNSIKIVGINSEYGSGDDDNLPIVDGESDGDVMIITANNVEINNLILKNSGNQYWDSGIEIFSNNNIISGCVIYGNFYGININSVSYNEITQNIILLNVMDGIFMYASNGNIISKNNISDNGFQGIYLYGSDDNIISENEITLNGKDGIHFADFCTQNQVYGNTINSNDIDGIKIFFNENSQNYILGNIINHNRWNGIHFMNGYNNHILDNTISTNHFNGIHFGNSNGNHIIGNTISYSSNEGIFILGNSLNNEIFYNNLIFNSAHDSGSNVWDNDYPYGGNYWTYYAGIDSNGDGIGDTPFYIPGGSNVDRYPIMNPVIPPNIPEKPSGRIYGDAGKEYTYFTSSVDSNNDSIQYGWDWDGDKIIDEWTNSYPSGEKCYASHTWSEKGTYRIYVKAMDIRGMDSDWSEGLTVIMPRPKTINKPFLGLLQDHLNLLTILRQLLQLFGL